MLNKRWVSAGITVLGAIFLLAGCGEKRGQRTNGLDTEEMAGHDGCIVVGYAQVGSESDWRTTNTQSFKNIFTEENGYYLIFEDGQQKQENQVKAIRNFILQDVDYIILDPVVETGWEAVLEEAKEAGIPVILSDRTVEVGDESLYSCWVGSNFCEEGIKAGEWLENYLKNYRGAMIMVTHDRYFLDSVCNRIVEIDQGKIYSYETNYSGYLEARAQRIESMEVSERKRQDFPASSRLF